MHREKNTIALPLILACAPLEHGGETQIQQILSLKQWDNREEHVIHNQNNSLQNTNLVPYANRKV